MPVAGVRCFIYINTLVLATSVQDKISSLKSLQFMV